MRMASQVEHREELDGLNALCAIARGLGPARRARRSSGSRASGARSERLERRLRPMRDRAFWKTHYVVRGDADEIERHMTLTALDPDGGRLQLVSFVRDERAPNVLVSPGSGGHAYVFAELAFEIHLRGFNVFVMPKHGGRTVADLVHRHRGTLESLARAFSGPIGVYGEGLGGYVAFYLALAGGRIRSLVCQNSPAIMVEPAYHDAIVRETGPWAAAARRRRRLLPLATRLVRAMPRLPVPISSYLDWRALIDPREPIERRLVEEGYLRDPNSDRWYPLAAVVSLVTTPPPRSLAALHVPTMFVLAREGPTPAYARALYERLPVSPKKLFEVDGSVYWMLSHPAEAAEAISAWFARTL